MKAKDLKELVKSYFNLQDKMAFGELKDVNGAFTLIFEGEALELGKAVTVRTAEGQELSAPDGYHNLEGGITIKTEGGIVVEMEKEAELVEQVTPPAIEETNTTTEKSADPNANPVTDSIIKLPVEINMAAEGEGVQDTLTFPQIAEAIAEVIKSEMEFVKKEMAELKTKMEKYSAEPAAEKTIPAKKSFSLDARNNDIIDVKRYAMMRELIKNKKTN
jgi:hypothetical protein